MIGTLPPVKSVTRLADVVDRELIRGTELFAELDEDGLDLVVASVVQRDAQPG